MEKNNAKFPLLVMAGGMGSRMDFPDKGILMFHGNTLIDRGVNMLKDYTKNVFIATSDNTRITKEYYGNKYKIIETGGHGYSTDLSSVLGKIGVYPIIVIPSDLYISHESVIQRFMNEALHRNSGIVSMLIGGLFCGLSIFFSNPESVEEDKFYYVNFTERDAFNINTKIDYYLLLNRAERMK